MSGCQAKAHDEMLPLSDGPPPRRGAAFRRYILTEITPAKRQDPTGSVSVLCILTAVF